MSQHVESRRRWFGLFFLLVAAGMLVWGQTWLRSQLAGVGFVIYWLLCLVFTFLALVTALLDARATRRRIRAEHEDMVRRTLGGRTAARLEEEAEEREKCR